MNSRAEYLNGSKRCSIARKPWDFFVRTFLFELQVFSVPYDYIRRKMNKLKAYFEANRPRTAREKYLFVQMCIKHVYAPLGVKMTSPDYKWGFLNSLTWSAIVMLYICATYTIVYFWYRDDHMQSLQTLCLLAVLTPVSFHPQLSLTHHLIEIHCLRVPSSFGPSPREVVWKHFRR